MHRLVTEHLEALVELCRRYHVRRLELFGSAAVPARDAEPGDLDFLVEFSAVEAMSLADQYFGLLQALEDLFHRDVDLVTPAAIRNPYLRQAIDDSRVPLYAA